MLTLTPSKTLSDEPICSHTCSMDHLMISQYWRKSADTIVPDSKEWNEVDRSKKPFSFNRSSPHRLPVQCLHREEDRSSNTALLCAAHVHTLSYSIRA